MCVLAVCLAGAGCGSDDDSGGSGGADSNNASRGDRALIDKAAQSTVSVSGIEGDFHSHGSGVLIDAAKGLVLTAGHVVDTAKSVSVNVGGKVKAKARVVARAQCENLALLSIYPEQSSLVAMPFADTGGLSSGDRLIALGFPGLPQKGDALEQVSTTQGPLSTLAVNLELTTLLPEFEGLIAHQAPVVKSYAGGPLIDSRGRFIGLNMTITGPYAGKTLPGLSYAIPATHLKERVDELKPGDKSLYSGWEKYHKCHSDMEKLARSLQVENHDLPPGYKATRGKTKIEHEGH